MGGYGENWSDVGMVWGRTEPLSASQKDFDTRPQPEVTHRILLRFRLEYVDGKGR
ncbi:head-tail joining protein [Ochrobactrum sp. J50]|nr:head-tail joining protein [Ochrobactrum sp. J50]